MNWFTMKIAVIVAALAGAVSGQGFEGVETMQPGVIAGDGSMAAGDLIIEGEWDQCEEGYVDLFNSGCAAPGPPYPFSEIACGDKVYGWTSMLGGATGTVRDMDWYAFELESETHIHLRAVADCELAVFMLDPVDGDCGEQWYTILSAIVTPVGEDAVMEITYDPGELGLAWLLVTTLDDYEFTDCPVDYVFGLECDSVCAADITGDGVVDVLDLLAVLAAWGQTGELPEDITGDGVVDVLDLLEVLAAWGPCP